MCECGFCVVGSRYLSSICLMCRNHHNHDDNALNSITPLGRRCQSRSGEGLTLFKTPADSWQYVLLSSFVIQCLERSLYCRWDTVLPFNWKPTTPTKSSSFCCLLFAVLLSSAPLCSSMLLSCVVLDQLASIQSMLVLLFRSPCLSIRLSSLLFLQIVSLSIQFFLFLGFYFLVGNGKAVSSLEFLVPPHPLSICVVVIVVVVAAAANRVYYCNQCTQQTQSIPERTLFMCPLGEKAQ